jgi:PAS domain S-box-containing protein
MNSVEAIDSDQIVGGHATGIRVALASSALVTSIGTLSLIGWTFGIEQLKSLGGPVNMKANMAIGLIACGLGLNVVARGRVLGAAVAVVAGLAGTIGALTLSQHLFGWDLGIDELLFAEEPGAAATASPGRMGPNGSSSLVLVSMALLSLAGNTMASVNRAQFLAALVAILAMLPVIGYWYGAHELYSIARYTGIALPTAVAFLALSVGILSARAAAGQMASFTGSGPGGIMARRVAVAAIAVPLVLGYGQVLGQRAGAVDTGLGTALLVLSLVAIFIVAVARAARMVDAAHARQRRTEEALQASGQNFAEMFRALPIGVSVARLSDGAILEVNEAFTALTGFARDETLGTTPARLGLIENDSERRRLLDPVVREGFVQNAELSLITKAGEPRHVVLNLSVIEIDGLKRILSTIVDITARKKAEETLRSTMQELRESELRFRRAADVAESANRIKDQFLATLSHELRTPLNAILGYARMLRTGAWPEEKRQQAVEIIERNALVQNQLVEDLLDISRMTTGRIRLDMQLVPAIGPLQEAIDSIKPTADAKGIALDIQVDPFAGAVSADPGRLQQIFWNLLSNAVKFTDPGGRVTVTLTSEAGWVRAAVCDTGTGISPTFLPYVFDAFRQADAGFTRVHSGLGLGLAICKQLVELHAGTLSAASDGPGRGAVFTVCLPTQAAADLQPPLDASVARTPSATTTE